METNEIAIISVLLYKIATLLLGGFSIYLGYKLFIKGVWGNAGDLKANFSNNKLVLKSAAPGTFFAVLGAIIIVTSILMKFTINNEITQGYEIGDQFSTYISGEDEDKKPILRDIEIEESEPNN